MANTIAQVNVTGPAGDELSFQSDTVLPPQFFHERRGSRALKPFAHLMYTILTGAVRYYQDNPADALFCMKCGTKVEKRCASCNTVNPADANFCRKCGASLEAVAPVKDRTSSVELSPPPRERAAI
jgi:ribosomal protein L40E